MSHARRLILLGSAVAALAVFSAGHARAQVADHELKAAFVLRFVTFLSWPSGALPSESPIVIGVLGGEFIGAALERIAWGEKRQGRRIVVRSIESLAEAQTVHMLVVSRSESKRLRELFDALAKSAVVTVSDAKGFASRGGVIELVEGPGGRMGFEINLTSAESAGVRVSSKLLRIAQRVHSDSAKMARTK